MTKKHSVEYVREFCLRKNIILMQDYYSGNKIRLKLKCAVDGYEWNARFDSLAGMNSGCPKCAKNIALTEPDLNEEVEEILLKANLTLLSNYESKVKFAFNKISSTSSFEYGFLVPAHLKHPILVLKIHLNLVFHSKPHISHPNNISPILEKLDNIFIFLRKHSSIKSCSVRAIFLAHLGHPEFIPANESNLAFHS